MEMSQTVPMRSYLAMLGFIAAVDTLLMLTFNVALERANFAGWARAGLDAALLVGICAPLLFKYQLRPLQVANHDQLTGLPNRRLFNDRLEHALLVAKRENKHCALIFLDLDRFKPINDNFGHHTGDIILQQVAKRLRDCVRQSDTVARIGGDEFTVLLIQMVKVTSVERVVQKIVRELNRPFEVNGRHIELGVSAGVALYPFNGKDGVTLLDAADDAMYCAKTSDHTNYCFASREFCTWPK